MKSYYTILLALAAPWTDAMYNPRIPSLPDNLTHSQIQNATILGQKAANAIKSGATPQFKLSNSSFNAALQKIDVGGRHAFKAPGLSDARGPCPGLNALANHGYIPRNGYASVFDLITATTTVFGMGVDLAVILTAYGLAFDGVGLGWSIGGVPRNGIAGSSGHYETDNSAIMADLHQYGSNSDVVISQFQDLFDLQPDAATANYDIDVLAKFRKGRFQESIDKNPLFYYGPFSGTLVSAAAFTFIYRFMANHTAENPAGILNRDTLASFYSVSGSSGNYTWTRGSERIPENWYRRSLTDPYGVFGLAEDVNTLGKVEPRILKAGCNNGTVDSYMRIENNNSDPNYYDFSNPLDSVCFALAEVFNVINLLPVAGDLLDLLLLPVQNTLSCPTVANKPASEACPGYAFYGGPTGSVAPGAIQN